MSQDTNKIGRDPFQKREKKETPNTLFTDVLAPQSPLEKIKEMQIKVDWTEMLQSVKHLKDVFFLIPVLLMLTGCQSFLSGSSNNSTEVADLKKQLIDSQKVVNRQSSQIEELNSKILLLTDRMDHFVQPHTPSPTSAAKPANQNAATQPASVPPLLGDAKVYEMVLKDLKSNSLDSMSKHTELLVKGFKDSPYTNNALFLLGESQFKKGNYTKASETFERLYRMSPDGNKAVQTMYYLGLCYEKLQKKQQASEAFQTVMNIYPGSREAQQASLKMAQLKRDK